MKVFALTSSLLIISYSLLAQNSTTKIQYELHYPATKVNLSIYNSIGNKISELVNGPQGPGAYSVSYDAHNYSSGIYYYRLETSYSTLTKRMVFIK